MAWHTDIKLKYWNNTSLQLASTNCDFTTICCGDRTIKSFDGATYQSIVGLVPTSTFDIQHPIPVE
jgi:hypothetical protein